ncbi:hypothetical protein A616_16590 [Brevibacillus brevis X23]|nr:hypothetical protein A616_16590 [Brevibacillus brevis X23]
MKIKEEYAIGYQYKDEINFVTEDDFYSNSPDKARIFSRKEGALVKRKYLQEQTDIFKKEELKIISITTTAKPIGKL